MDKLARNLILHILQAPAWITCSRISSSQVTIGFTLRNLCSRTILSTYGLTRQSASLERIRAVANQICMFSKRDAHEWKKGAHNPKIKALNLIEFSNGVKGLSSRQWKGRATHRLRVKSAHFQNESLSETVFHPNQKMKQPSPDRHYRGLGAQFHMNSIDWKRTHLRAYFSYFWNEKKRNCITQPMMRWLINC